MNRSLKTRDLPKAFWTRYSASWPQRSPVCSSRCSWILQLIGGQSLTSVCNMASTGLSWVLLEGYMSSSDRPVPLMSDGSSGLQSWVSKTEVMLGKGWGSRGQDGKIWGLGCLLIGHWGCHTPSELKVLPQSSRFSLPPLQLVTRSKQHI